MRIVRHSLLNLIGLGAPLLLAVFAIPLLVTGLGTERFGLLTLIWALVSYFGLFDLGLGRALTLRLAVTLERGEDAEVGPLCGTALALMAAFGLLMGLLLYLSAPWLLGLLSALPDFDEALVSLRWMALALPFAIVTAGLRGMLEARGAFGLVNGIRLPMGVWTFAAPMLALWLWGSDLAAISALLVLGRMLGTVAHAVAVWRVLPQLRGRLAWRSDLPAALLRSGGWLLISNVLGPLMGYADRFIVGAFVPISALSYYATPQEMVMKLWVLPGALTAVLFPALAAQIARGERGAAQLCHQALLGLSLILLPITLGLATFAQPLLSIWLGPEFASESATCLLIFSLGMFVTGLAQLPYTALQSAGRADTTAKLHLLELPLFMAALAWASAQHGIEGAAWVWFARVLADAVLLFLAAQRIPLQMGVRLLGHGALRILTLAPLGFAGLLLPGFAAQVGAWLFVCCACLICAVQALRHRSRTMRISASS